MANCCICGRKTNFISGETRLSPAPEHYDKIICNGCDQKKREIALGDPYLHASLDYFNEFLPGIMNTEVKQYIYSVIEEGNRLFQSQRDRGNEMENILLNSGYNFEGYKIVKYLGFVSAEAKPFTYGTVKDMETHKRELMKSLKIQALSLGANALIGLRLEYNLNMNTTFVALNGTAVKIKREDE